MNRSEKAALIAQIKAKADAASFVVVTDFKGMTVEELTRLRAKLYECGGEYLVVKNTLARIALTDGMHDSVKDMFKENCGIALTSQDPGGGRQGGFRICQDQQAVYCSPRQPRR